MSKMDGLRAMREARYQASASRAEQPAATKTVRGEPRPARPTKLQPSGSDEEAAAPALCGHRSMNGRSCTREHGHASKSHRYS